MNYPEDFINKIIHGDCLEVMKDIPDESIDLIVTDPPYGIEYQSNKQLGNTRNGHTETTREEHFFDKIKNDDEFPIDWLEEAYRALKIGGALYTFCHWKVWGDAFCAVESVGFIVKNMIVLNKSNHGMGDLKGSFAPKHELLLFAAKGRHLLSGEKRPKDVIDVPVKFSGARRLHPNEKPKSWYEIGVINSSKDGDIVLDPFIGSGTLAELCIEINRNFIGIDLSEEYCEIAKERINNGI